jgi:hypothetical protein
MDSPEDVLDDVWPVVSIKIRQLKKRFDAYITYCVDMTYRGRRCCLRKGKNIGIPAVKVEPNEEGVETHTSRVKKK